MIINVNRLTFYAYFEEEVIALGKLMAITVRYFQNDLEEIYNLNCKIF